MLIELKNLKKIYFDDGVKTEALRGINLIIKKKEFVAIMGPSGSGKSTLLHILGFLDKQTSGEYFFEGKSNIKYSEKELAYLRNQKVGFVFQNFNLLLKLSVYENVKLPLIYSQIPFKKWDEIILKIISEVGLKHRINHLTSQLSGGEKQRVAIARALVLNPEIIFLDEPTGNLDSSNGKQIMELILNLFQKFEKTIVLITHDINIARYAQRLIKIKDGLIESDELLK
ncbi:MAG: ABC transporter ATP-binding protein [Candidatus Pacearchaeota archaeon]